MYTFDSPLIFDKDSIINSCFKDFHENFFHNFKYECIHDIKLTNITNNEIFNLTNSGKSINSYDLYKKVKFARQNGFFIPTNKQTNKKNLLAFTI